MITETNPSMAFPSFASATATFAPAAWPSRHLGGVSIMRFEAVGRTAGGVLLKQVSSIGENRISLAYQHLTTAERDSFLNPSGAGFLTAAAGSVFEYKHFDGSIHRARFASVYAESSSAGRGFWSLGPLELVIGV